LRYVDADDLDDSAVDFDGMNVESQAGEKLGDVDGFIVDINSARPLYVVVDAGGWFTSKYFLLPVGHVGLDTAAKKMVADVARDRVAKFPGFDRDEFSKLSDGELNRMDERMIAVCCPDELVDRSTMGERYDRWTHYRNPTWWDASYYRPDRADTAARSMASAGTPASIGTTPPSRDTVRADRDVVRVREREREAVVAREGAADDVSPHVGGRAQPGDVLGLETGGEQTHIGETTEDENKRREDAEKDARRK
jgi:hypothetical protein